MTTSNSVSTHLSPRSNRAVRVPFSLSITNDPAKAPWPKTPQLYRDVGEGELPRIQSGSHCTAQRIDIFLKDCLIILQSCCLPPFPSLGTWVSKYGKHLLRALGWTMEAITGSQNAIHNWESLSIWRLSREGYLFVGLVWASHRGEHRMTVKYTTSWSPCFGLCSWVLVLRPVEQANEELSKGCGLLWFSSRGTEHRIPSQTEEYIPCFSSYNFSDVWKWLLSKPQMSFH